MPVVLGSLEVIALLVAFLLSASGWFILGRRYERGRLSVSAKKLALNKVYQVLSLWKIGVSTYAAVRDRRDGEVCQHVIRVPDKLRLQEGDLVKLLGGTLIVASNSGFYLDDGSDDVVVEDDSTFGKKIG